MKIKNILTTKGATVITIQPDQTLKEAVDLLSTHNIGALVVVNRETRLVGILSERDIIRAAGQHDDVLSRHVREVMTRAVITGLPQDDVKSVLQTMSKRKIRHLPILDQGKLIGMVSIRDLIQTLLDEYEGEIETLEVRIIESEERESGLIS